jgi:hypothetical protein
MKINFCFNRPKTTSKSKNVGALSAKLLKLTEGEILERIKFVKEFFWPEVEKFITSKHEREGKDPQ